MFTNTFRDATLNTLDSHFCGLITAITDWRAGTVTEANYTGYGTRPGITFGAAGNTTPTGGRQRANSAVVTFPTNTGSSQDVIGYTVTSAATAGTIKAIGLLDTDVPLVGTGSTGDTITTESAHGLIAGQRVFVLAAPGAVIPTGLSENTIYFVRTTGLTTTAFTLSTTGAGGTVVDITAGGAALFIPFTPVTIAAAATPEFAIGTIVAQF